MLYLSSVYYSNMHTLSETGNTIENLLKYAQDISWNNKELRDSPDHAATAFIRKRSFMLI